MNRATCVLIDRLAMQANLLRVRELVPHAKIMAVVKADGYGHSMELAANALIAADEFAVTSLDDVNRLRSAGFDKVITMLSSTFNVDDLNRMCDQRVRPVIYDQSQLPLLSRIDSSADLDLWLKVDTGMGRLGLSIDDASQAIAYLKSISGVKSLSAMTHLANADVPLMQENQNQIDLFFDFAQQHDLKELSLMNSAGTIAFSDQAADTVRTGIVLYGVSPFPNMTAQELNLRPAMTFKSNIISTKHLGAGSSVGYGGTHVLSSDTDIAVIACGYADGYPRHAPTGTPVLINGTLVPLIGRVSMDLITVDLQGLKAQVGDEAVLWGPGNPVEEIARLSGTIAYELISGISARVERISV